MRIDQWLSYAITQLLMGQHSHDYDKASAQLESELLLAYHLKKTRAFLLTYPEKQLDSSQINQLNDDLQQIKTGYPLAYLLGSKAFWDMELKVNESTLIPRVDTEVLIEYLIEHYSKQFNGNILDLGTGSGAIAIALSREFENAQISAVDNSLSALAIAYTNAQQWQKTEVDFYHADWFTLKSSYPQNKKTTQTMASVPLSSLDIIISNPPYIDKKDTHLDHLIYEPMTALVSEEKGLSDIKQIIQQTKKYLKPDGLLILEHGYDQTQNVQQLLQQNSYTAIHTHKDLAGNPRFSTAKL